MSKKVIFSGSQRAVTCVPGHESEAPKPERSMWMTQAGEREMPQGVFHRRQGNPIPRAGQGHSYLPLRGPRKMGSWSGESSKIFMPQNQRAGFPPGSRLPTCRISHRLRNTLLFRGKFSHVNSFHSSFCRQGKQTSEVSSRARTQNQTFPLGLFQSLAERDMVRGTSGVFPCLYQCPLNG